MTGKKKLFKSIMKHLEGLISKVVLNGSLERKKNRERVLSRISSKGKQIPHHFVKASLRYRYEKFLTKASKPPLFEYLAKLCFAC